MKEIVLISGIPAGGKSSLVSHFPTHERLNRDTFGGSLSEIATELNKRILAGKTQFVLDNTYCFKAQRKEIIDIAKKYHIPVRILWLETSIEDAQVNAVTRMIRKYGKLLTPEEMKAKKDPNMFPPAVLFAFRKNVEIPDKSEGFDNIEFVPFIRKPNPSYKGKAIVIDYDGTVRKSKSGQKYPTSPNDVEIFPHVPKILKHYASQGFKILGASNQSGVAKGVFTHDQAVATFQYTNKLLGIDIDYSFCPHAPVPITCFCRKPMPGIGIQFVEKYHLDPIQTKMIGDMTSDKTFAQHCGFEFVPADKFFKP